MMRSYLAVLLLLMAAVGAAADEPSVRETTVDFAVKRASETKTPKTLRFLHANRNFLRSELDRLQTHRVVREGDARELSDRERFLIAQQEQISADADTLRAAIEEAQRADYLQSAADLLAFEEYLDRLEFLMERQNARLQALEADFVARQETALALYVTGLGSEEPESILVSDPEGDQWQIRLDDRQRAALRNGASAELFHEFVEPRRTTYALSLQRTDGQTVDLGTLELQPARDRLTLVEVDLAKSVDGSLALRSWER